MSHTYIGKDFTPPDIQGKVTGSAKYAEDYTVDGMVYARLYTSPMPHARVTGIDATAALAMEGVFGILTADDVPAVDERLLYGMQSPIGCLQTFNRDDFAAAHAVGQHGA